MSNDVINPYQTFYDDSGVPVANGTIDFFVNKTTTPDTIYSDEALTVAQSNPYTLDAYGRIAGDVKYEGIKTLRLKDSSGTIIRTMDNVATTTSTELYTRSFDTVSDMVAATGLVVGDRVETYGHTTVGDGGGNNYEFVAAGTGTHDNGSYIDSTGSPTGQFKGVFPGVVNIKQFGAVGDDTADDTVAIQAAIDYGIAANKKPVSDGSTYKISSKVVIKGDCDFSQATFNVYDTPAVAVEVSTGSATDPTDNLFNKESIWLPAVINTTKPGTGWSGQGVGVRTVNVSSCNIFVGNIRNFARNLLLTSFSAGNSYNNYYMGHLENGEINCLLDPGNSGAWVNENVFIGGRLSHFSAEGTNVSGTRHIEFTEATNPVNNNLFVRPSIEGNTAEFHVNCGGSANTLQQARWEASPPKIQFFGSSTSYGARNILLGGFGIQDVVVTYSGTPGKNNSIIAGAEEVIEMGASGQPLRAQNVGSSASDIRRYYGASEDPWANGSDWSVAESSQVLQGKRPGDTYARLQLDYQDGLIYYDNGTTAAPTTFIGAFGAGVIRSGATFWPGTDNSFALGNGSFRWSEVFAANGTINTSDERSKQQIRLLSDREREVAKKLKGLVRAYKFNDSVDKKGDDARINFGVVAQDVVKAFDEQGLDAMKYAVVCYDEWDDVPEETNKDGTVLSPARPAGNAYGIRYDQLLAFIISAM